MRNGKNMKKAKVLTFSTLVGLFVVAFLVYKVIKDFEGIDPFDVDFDN